MVNNRQPINPSGSVARHATAAQTKTTKRKIIKKKITFLTASTAATVGDVVVVVLLAGF